MAAISETAHPRAKISLIWAPWGISVYIYRIYAAKLNLTLKGHFKITHFKMAAISETACRRAKIRLIWAPWGISVYIYSIYAAKIAFVPSRSLQGHTFQNGRDL